MVFPFKLASFRTSSACDGCKTCCSMKSSATCLSFIDWVQRQRVESLKGSSADVTDGYGNNFFGGGHSGQNLADTVFAQGSHAEFAGALSQVQGRAALVNHVADFVIDDK